jgi:effector-binding domain-containing protein
VEAKDNIVSENLEKIKSVVNFIRKNSLNGKFTKYEDLLTEPINIKEESINEIMHSLKTSTDYQDIVELKGKQCKYLYSNKEMTQNYANMLFKIEEKDLLQLLIETVRYDSKIYPKATALNSFYDEPFGFSEEIINGIIKQIKENNEYNDIQKTSVSNGKIYLYSTKYLSKDYGESLAEWIAVGQYESY